MACILSANQYLSDAFAEYITMDSIKKKMQSLANETANATARAERWEKEMSRINETADQYEEQVIMYTFAA